MPRLIKPEVASAGPLSQHPEPNTPKGAARPRWVRCKNSRCPAAMKRPGSQVKKAARRGCNQHAPYHPKHTVSRKPGSHRCLLHPEVSAGSPQIDSDQHAAWRQTKTSAEPMSILLIYK